MMNWAKLLNAHRLGHRPPKVELGRSPFNSDHDKVIFSGSFRRLARKTQVHPLALNDHVHNRLTHSLEVASVGRTLAISVGSVLQSRDCLPDGLGASDLGDIVQTACLAHDIGNPPFGHTGEEAIRQWFASKEGQDLIVDLTPSQKCDLENFEGNAQGLRILTCSEFHPYDGGMRLTYASLGAFIKYPWTSHDACDNNRPKNNKFGVYQSEKEQFNEVAEALGLIKKGDDWYSRHPLVHLVELADDFCYGILDLEDGIDMGILSWEEVFEICEPLLDGNKLPELQEHIAKFRTLRRPPLIRGKIISALVEDAAAAFVANETLILQGELNELLPKCSPEVREFVRRAKDLAQRKVYNHPRKVELEIGAYNTLATLLSIFCCAVDEYVKNSGRLSFRSKRALDLIGDKTFHPTVYEKTTSLGTRKYLALARVLDFVSGMTDNYASHLARQFAGIGGAR